MKVAGGKCKWQVAGYFATRYFQVGRLCKRA